MVINKFLNMEGRINALSEILPAITVNEAELSTEMQKFYRQIVGNTAGPAESVQTEMDFEQ